MVDPPLVVKPLLDAPLLLVNPLLEVVVPLLLAVLPDDVPPVLDAPEVVPPLSRVHFGFDVLVFPDSSSLQAVTTTASWATRARTTTERIKDLLAP